jgi:NADP-dependent 3-hydroxy acid dehydrogenase YdfG
MGVGLLARDTTKLEELANVRSLAERLGPVEVLEYSPLPAKAFMKPILSTSVADLRGPLEFSVLGAVAAATVVVGPMIEAGSGSILFTTGGAAVKPHPERAGAGVSLAAEVAYARMLHEELAKKGVRVGHNAIAGRIVPGGDHEPADVAEALWRPHADHGEFQLRLGFD